MTCRNSAIIRKLCALLLLLPALVAPEEACPADGSGPGCSAASLIPEQDLKCMAWRQTGGCTPKGPRESQGDMRCEKEVESGKSGYCECGAERRARQVHCGHRPFTCDSACKQLRRYTCVGWRQTGGCNADGAREPDKDKMCYNVIENTMSGFCECGDGRLVRKSGCEHGSFLDKFTCADECAAEPDLYEELGLESGASDKAIKQAFRKLSLKFHPDKTRNDPVATIRFSEIRESYEILSDPEQRGTYDSNGIKAVYEARSQKIQKGPSITGEVKVTLENLYNGQEVATQVSRKVICRGCKEQWTEKCNRCTAGCANEIEIVHVRMGPMVMQQQQEVASKQRCRDESTTLPITVEPGMANGDEIVFKGMGEHRPNMIPGDVVLTIREEPHEVFERKGIHLHTEVEISLKEALLGFERSVTQLDGRSIVIAVQGVTPPFGVLKVVDEGMPNRGDPTQRGTMYVKCRIKMPKEDQLSEIQRKWLQDNFPN